MTRRHVFHLLAIVLFTAVGLTLAELMAAAFAWDTQGDVPWLGKSNVLYAQKARDVADPRLRLSPYYGYMARPGMRLADVTDRAAMAKQFGQRYIDQDHDRVVANRYGFESLYEYPYADSSAFVIGVFGGSVALQFSLTMTETLHEHLAAHPRLGGRRVVLLDFANGGTKQPQQATTLAYFLAIGQRFDLILNLDGFNELFIGWYNAFKHDVDEQMPFARFITGIQNFVLESHGVFAGDNRASRIRLRLDEISRLLQRPQFALRALWLHSEARRLADRLVGLEKELTQPDAASLAAMPLLPRTSPTAETSQENVVRAWVNGSLAMAGMARSFGIPYLHVLQPNQYFTGAKFTEEQRKEFLNLQDPPVASLVPAHYRAYLAEADVLKRNGVRFLDATRVFDESDGSVFADHCCHLNEAGNKILAAAIAQGIKAALDDQETRAKETAPR